MENKETKNKDKAAFPAIDTDYFQMGLTKREFFAAKALQGLCAGRSEHEQPGTSVKYAVELADALIEELDN